METSQRVVKEIVAKDTQQIGDLLSSLGRLMAILTDSVDEMQNFSSLANKNHAVNILTSNVFEVSFKKKTPI